MTSGVYTRIKIDPVFRFNQKYREIESGCWEWMACRSPQGYGNFWDGNSLCLAHRFSYEIKNGPIQKGLVIDHLCRNPRCVNPAHLECVTMAENTRRGMLYDVIREKHRMQTHCLRGHALDGDNLIINRKGHRCCKICQRTKAEEWRKKNIERVNEKQKIRRSRLAEQKEERTHCKHGHDLSIYKKKDRNSWFCSACKNNANARYRNRIKAIGNVNAGKP